MADAIKEFNSDTLVIFDLDNTVMMPAQTLGGEEWYDYLVTRYSDELKKRGESDAAAKSKAIARAKD
jgi:hypothetical protein